jgi:sulfide:quinone oxidoreductase
MSEERYEVLIVGGGTAGISIAARLMNLPEPPTVAIVEPSEKHYYQPIWTLVGAGIFPKEVSERAEADFMPPGVTWIKDRVEGFQPDASTITTAGGRTIAYGDLVVALGIQIDLHKVKGLEETLGKNGVTTNYLYSTVDYTWKLLDDFVGGTALFTFPATSTKCPGAPQKIMWLADDHFRRKGVRSKSKVIFASAGAAIFGVPRYRAALEKLVAARDIDTRFDHNLIELRAKSKEAVFKVGSDEKVIKYDMIHVTPPQGPPDVIKASALADADGWVAVDKHTLQHTRFPNVWSAGDCSSAPKSRTGAAVRKEAPVLVENLVARRAGKPLTGHYDGYASCPLVTARGRCILAEFGYDGKIMETFPFDQTEERFSMYTLTAYALPAIYWHGMLRGRM